jgi:chromosome segregation ATPase
MASRRPSIAEQRLAHVRAIKEEFFHEELSLEEQLQVKEARIAELEREVEDLRERLRRSRSDPEDVGPTKPVFDFYRD